MDIKPLAVRNVHPLDLLKAKLKKAETLLMDIKVTGSHHQIVEKIDEYFKENRKEE
tara:strand:- start:888 stop:1055 length:168 start_codon:yes stop_codon:yes gene_type:complete